MLVRKVLVNLHFKSLQIKNQFPSPMKTYKLIIIIFLCIYAARISAQVTFIVQSLPSNTPAQDMLYIGGDFNGWDPGSAQYILHKNVDGKWSITLPAQASGTTIEYKFTRGSWGTVEKGQSGIDISNRTFTYGNSSSVVDITIYNWANAGGGSSSTAASNVKIISTDFLMPQFNRTRRIWMYFPPDYETSGINYPVLYMHDGQNLFDNLTSYAGEWKVDETLNALAAQGKRVPIVVGIDNGPERIAEYTPWANLQYGGGDGDKYMQFIIETLKPYIDQHYHTLPNRENTGIMGSSLGGLISHYGALKYQSTFSKAGLFSPSYWFSENVWSFSHDMGKQQDMKFFQLCGSAESTTMVGEMQRMNDSLVKIGFAQDKIFNKVVPDGQHNEKLWRDAFGEAYLWLFDSYITSVSKTVAIKPITCFPNPVRDELTFRTDGKITFDSIQIIDINGKQVKIIVHPTENRVDVHDLLSGTYMIRGITKGESNEGKFIKK